MYIYIYIYGERERERETICHISYVIISNIMPDQTTKVRGATWTDQRPVPLEPIMSA